MPGKLITPAPTQRTNTLIITQLPAEFFHPAVLTALRDHLALFGTIFAWAPLRGLLRIILVYLSEDDAENAKHHCDGLTLDELPNRCVALSYRLISSPNTHPFQTECHTPGLPRRSDAHRRANLGARRRLPLPA